MTLSALRDYIEEHNLAYLGSCPVDALPGGRKPKSKESDDRRKNRASIAIYCHEGHFLSISAAKNAVRILRDGKATDWSPVEGSVSELLESQRRSGFKGLGNLIDPESETVIHFSS